MSGLTTFNIRCHNIIQNANLAIISHITKQKTKKSKNPQGKQSPKQVPCAAALPQPQPATQPAFHPASRSPHVPQLPPSPSHSSPPVPATAVPQSQPQLSPSPSHSCPPVPATAVHYAAMPSQPSSKHPSKRGPPCHGTAVATISPKQPSSSSEVPRATAVPWPKIRGPKIPYKKSTQKKITKNLHSKKNSSNFASLFQKMESTQFGM